MTHVAFPVLGIKVIGIFALWTEFSGALNWRPSDIGHFNLFSLKPCEEHADYYWYP